MVNNKNEKQRKDRKTNLNISTQDFLEYQLNEQKALQENLENDKNPFIAAFASMRFGDGTTLQDTINYSKEKIKEDIKKTEKMLKKIEEEKSNSVSRER